MPHTEHVEMLSRLVTACDSGKMVKRGLVCYSEHKQLAIIVGGKLSVLLRVAI